MASPASAQSAASSTIHGVVRDGTGGALPGVTVTLASPALQVRQIVVVTEGDGGYRIGDLPAGTYRLTFELSGFSTFIREELRLTIGFTARVDVTMGVGTLEESVTVSGQSPVVDLTSSGTASNFTAETLETIPRGRDFQAVVDMAPGVTREGAPDVGGSQISERPSMSTYGLQATTKIQVEGINITTGSDANTAVYLNYFGMDEVQIKTSGTSADVGTPGVEVIAVLKSGGNEFHGQYEGSYQGPTLQSSNLTPELQAQGLSDTEPLRFHYDIAADLGGRIIRDKLWFYGGFSRQHRSFSRLGFVSGPGPDGVYLTGDEPLEYYNSLLSQVNAKVSWQVSPSNRLIGVYQKGLKEHPQRDGGRFVPLEATKDYKDPGWVRKIELQSTPNNRMFVNVVGGYGGYFADYNAMRTPLYRGADFPSRLDRDTGLRTGGNWASDQRPRDNWQIDGSFSFLPERSFGGRHELKTGVTLYRYLHATGKLSHDHGNYTLIYDQRQPVEINFYNWPVAPQNRVNVYAGHLMDKWRVSNRLTANLGLRIERQDAFVPAQSKEASPQFPQLFPSGKFSRVDVVTWRSVLPRLGLSWSLDRNTVVKATYGRYNALYRDADVGNFNQNAEVVMRYRWRDLDRNGNYTPGEVNLDTSGPDFISISGARNRIINPDLKQPMTTEVTASLEREVAQNLGVHVGYVFRTLDNLYAFGGINVLRPREVYNIALTRRDPGPDGILGTADDGGRVTLYDYDPAYRGAAFVGEMQVNTDKVDRFHTIEAALVKRLSGRWMAQVAAWGLKNHRWIEKHFATPNDDRFPLDETWNWGMNLSGAYRLPGDAQVAAFMLAKTGLQGARTYQFRRADPDGGPSLSQLSTLTLRLEPYGTRKGPAIAVTNLRLSKEFRLPRGQGVSFDVDLFNLFNSSVSTDIVWASGPTFGYVEEVLPARIVRIGGRYRF
ncbi:MAG: TonB-dependent receptor [Acidobacteria bacterium]|nr:TonB-dependent receptor [Acidobacteriota bacterium]